MEEAYCNYEISKLLKKKGFDEPCRSHYIDYEDYIDFIYHNDELTDLQMGVWETLRPTHQMACAWLREKEIEVDVYLSHITEEFGKMSKNYVFIINDINKGYDTNDEEDCKHYYQSYEEAVEAALKYTLENLI